MAMVNVKIPYTKVWYFDETDNTIDSIEFDGKLMNKEIKETLRDGQTMLEKEYFIDEFLVESYKLLQLKGDVL